MPLVTDFYSLHLELGRGLLQDIETTVEQTYRGLAIRTGNAIDRMGHNVMDGGPYPVSIAGPGNILNLNFTLFGTPIVSSRAAELFKEKCADDVQLIPAALAGSTAGWFALYIQPQSDCLDESRTEYLGHHASGRRSIFRPALHPARINAHGLQRILEYDTMILISHRLKSDLAVAGLIGWTYKPIDSTGILTNETQFV